MYDITQDWKYIAKNFNDISMKNIANEALLKLSIHILSTKYLKKEAFCFIKVFQNNGKKNKEIEIISDLTEKIKIKKILYKKKKNK